VSANAEKTFWILGPRPLAAAYREALTAFPEVSVALCGSPGSPRDTAGLAPPDCAIVGDVPGGIQHCLRLLMAGADLLVEPPVGLERGAAEALASAAEISNRTLLTGGARRFAPAWERAEHALAGSEIGRLRGLRAFAVPKDSSAHDRAATIASTLHTFERLGGPLEELRLEPATLVLETRHRSGVCGVVHLAAQDEPDRAGVVCQGEAGELWIGEGQVVLRRRGCVRVLGAGFAAPDVTAAAVRTLLRRRAQPFAEDDGVLQLARAHDALASGGSWRPA